METKKKKASKKREPKYEKKLTVNASFEELIAISVGKKISPSASKSSR